SKTTSLTVPERSRVPRTKSRSMRFNVSSLGSRRIAHTGMRRGAAEKAHGQAPVGRDLGTSSPVLELVNIEYSHDGTAWLRLPSGGGTSTVRMTRRMAASGRVGRPSIAALSAQGALKLVLAP